MENQKIIKRIIDKKSKLDSMRPLSKAVVKNLKDYFSIEWTYNSNAIEGNSLTLRETQLVLREGMTIKGKSLREHFEAKNHEKAISYLEKIVKPSYAIKKDDILSIHKIVLDGLEEEFAGRFRNGQVRIIGANFLPPNHLKVLNLIDSLVNFINKNPDKLDIVSHVAKIHHQLVWIHPFFDGNGRTARLVSNLWLMKHGYPPAVILKTDRIKYYTALNQANENNFDKLTLLIAQTIERSLDIYLNACSTSKDEEYVLLSKLAENTTYSQEYLSLLARQGKIDAFKQDRNWLSTKKSIDQYISGL